MTAGEGQGHEVATERAAERSLERLRALIRIATVAGSTVASGTAGADSGDGTGTGSLERFRAELARLYPAVHAELELEIVAGHSLLFRWPGLDREGSIVLMAHYDVVPAVDGAWTHPPFGAELTGDGTNRTLWGRGTLDDKGALTAITEAVDRLLADGFRPAHDVYLAFGHDEETGGSGARGIVDVLAARGIRPSMVLDEGGAVVEGIFPGVAQPIAVVGVAEKGTVSLVLSVEQSGGHASTPPRFPATVRLARAVTRLSRRPFPTRLSPVNVEMIRILGSNATGPLRLAARYPRLSAPAVRALLTLLSDETRAIVRTTHAVTQLSGSAAANVLAERAQATVNIRVAVGSSVREAIAHVRRAIRDPLVSLTPQIRDEPSAVSPSEGPEWTALTSSISTVYPGTIVTPYVMLAASDSRHYTRISANVYRFSPFEMSKDERATLHAANERIRVGTFLRGIDFFEHLLRNW